MNELQFTMDFIRFCFFLIIEKSLFFLILIDCFWFCFFVEVALKAISLTESGSSESLVAVEWNVCLLCLYCLILKLMVMPNMIA